jgi:peptidase S46-like protein
MRVKRSVWAATIGLAVAAAGCNGHLFPWAGSSAGPRTYVKPNVLPLEPAEGMWVYNHLPEGRLRTLFNFDVTKEWANNLQLASVKIGASGAFVSPDGLILTNHHVAAGGLQNASRAGKDYVTDGFLARSRDEEIKLPGLELSVLESIQDVTDRVNQGVDPVLKGEAAVKARNAVVARIESESQKATGLQSNVVTLYGGARYDLYRYKRYTDVRCVFAPEMAVAFFGGDPDNFEYPRYDLDITVLRAYEKGQPARVKNYLRISTQGVHENDLVFVSGNPGSTDRLLPVATLKMMRDLALPLALEGLERQERVLIDYSNRGPEERRQAQRDLFGIQNSLKALRPREAALKSDLMQRKMSEETAMREQFRQRADLSHYDQAYEENAVAEQRRGRLLVPYAFMEQGRGFATSLFSYARALVRLPEESAKPDAERLPEYTQAKRGPLEHRLLAEVPVYPELETARLTESLKFMQAKMPNSAIVKKILADKSPEDRAKELVGGTKLGDAAERKRLLEGGESAIKESKDPMIELVKSIDPEARQLRRDYESQVEEPTTEALTQINRARFDLYGSQLYPDATGTLRLAYGLVKGYQQDSEEIPAWTTIGGAFEHEQRHDGKPPYQLPDSWHKAHDRLDLKTPLNFVSTADITGGNSGSPVVNRTGELVGIIFDSNRQGVPMNFAYDDVQARAVSVDSRAVIEALRNIYGADALLSELLGVSIVQPATQPFNVPSTQPATPQS